MIDRKFDLIDSFRELKVLIIGEAMLDVYLNGSVQRICREAPAPIVDIDGQQNAAGGAANTAVNIRSLGGRTTFLSVVGDDPAGLLLRRILLADGVPVDDLLIDPGRSTLVKNRITAGSQILLRFDQGTTARVDDDTETELIDRISRIFPSSDAVVISDYGYGIVTPKALERVRELQASAPKVLVVDSKHLADFRSLHATSVKPNYEETLSLLGLEGSVTPEEITSYGEQILELTGSRIAAVTLDSKGALFFERGCPPYRTYARPAHRARGTGAGDTFVSALALCLAAGAPTAVAAEMASASAAVVVGKDGTTPCSAQELREYFQFGGKWVSGVDRLAERIELYRKQGQSIVFTNGCFDILHSGHVNCLHAAKAMGDVLIVGINSDGSVRRLKGGERPVNRLEDRIRLLAALGCVDHVVAFEEDTPVEIIRAVRPDVFVKGGDYTVQTLPEAPLVHELGGRVVILPYTKNLSTSGIIDRIRRPLNGESAGESVELAREEA